MKSLHLLLLRLTDAHFEYVIVGGFAAVLHGSSFITSDLDVCTTTSNASIAKLRTLLPELRPARRRDHRTLSFVDAASTTDTSSAFFRGDGGILDVLSSVKGVGDFARLRRNAINVTLFGRSCPLISLEDLIAAKEAVGREKDLLAVKELRAIAAKRAQRS